MRFAGAAALAAFVLATACTQVRTETPGTVHSWTQPGRLRIGYEDEPDNLNPMFGHSDATDQADAFLFAPLFRYDERGEFVPELATVVPSYANGGISPDGKTIVLHLRRGVTWADGAPLDARDFRFTWRAAMNPANNTKARDGWDDIAAIDLPDKWTAAVHLKRPNADVLGIFATGGSAYPPLPEHLLGKLHDLNTAAFNAAPLSSGPWILTSWQHGSSLTFAPNPRYWRGPPKLREIVWKIIPSTDTLFAQLQTHEIDVYPNVQENQVDRLPAIAGLRVDKLLIANWRHLGINAGSGALADVRVRRAIAEGVDWDQINATTYHGTNVRAVSDIMPTSWAAPSIPQFRFDAAAARSLLDAAGYIAGSAAIRAKEGRPLRLTISTATGKQANEQAELQIQQQLRAVGIDIVIKNYPTSLLFAQNGPLYTGNYNLEWSVDTNGPDPDNQALWSGDFIPPHGANTSFLRDPLITKLSDDAIRTYDRAKRKALYQREEERIHELTLAVFLYWQVRHVAYNSDLRNYKPAQYITNNWNSWEWEI